MDEKEFSRLSDKFNAICPAIVDDLAAYYLKEPDLVARYGPEYLRPMAQTTVNSFRDLLLGALQFETPGIVAHELKWVDRLLEARHFDHAKVPAFIKIVRQRVTSDMPSDLSAALVEALDSVEATYSAGPGRNSNN